MSKLKQIIVGDSNAGVRIEYIKSRKMIYVGGWYDTVCGIGGEEIPLAEFCKQLDITANDIEE